MTNTEDLDKKLCQKKNLGKKLRQKIRHDGKKVRPKNWTFRLVSIERLRAYFYAYEKYVRTFLFRTDQANKSTIILSKMSPKRCTIEELKADKIQIFSFENGAYSLFIFVSKNILGVYWPRRYLIL